MTPTCWLCSDRAEGCYTPDQCAPFVVSQPDLFADEPVVPDPGGRDA